MSIRTSKMTANTLLEAVRESLLRAGRYDPGTVVRRQRFSGPMPTANGSLWYPSCVHLCRNF